MRPSESLSSLILVFAITFHCTGINCEDPYRFFNWRVTYGDIHPLGVKQQGILINGQFPGPKIDAVTNDNLIISVHNYLKEPFLISWNGLQQRKNSWQDGVYGTNCPIPPGKNFTYVLQVKDQIGSFFYFPSPGMQKAAGGFGRIRIRTRPQIPVPFPPPAGDFSILAGDWFKTNHRTLNRILENGHNLPFPHGLIINGRGWNRTTFTVDQGKTYRFRISNVGLTTSINFRIQGHKMKLVEVEGSHTIQNIYSSLDIHLGQSYSVLVTADQPPKDYYIVVSTRFTKRILTTTATLHYNNSFKRVSGPIPPGPTHDIASSLFQARTIRWNLTASGPRPNPQGSYHYGLIKPTRSIILANSSPFIKGKKRYAVNSVSYVAPETPLKLADYFNISGVFSVGSIPTTPTKAKPHLQTSVMGANFREFVEIVFQNLENSVQSWHVDGYSFFVVGFGSGHWTPASRANYNLKDAIPRCTTQVYPRAWTAMYMALDNVGMWNIRSENWGRQLLGQQLCLRLYTSSNSLRDEYSIPKNAILCGRARACHNTLGFSNLRF
ncbi:L-ascorbate oxidase homolog [Abrus precatorius]|uniref:L-ascorbate oxidase homolog n=1 Tax=Abrus precatorius TaxID=3816 RepID=A0A8B8K539_ABRPR|nr:L-ascorbate oxidase homolog [Abrus precatorius]